jgi:predicted ribosomally synthesized peptide with SipW-like signal peptide
LSKILVSVLALALVGALAGGGLFAYFSDTETSTGNTFVAGTIDISLTGDIGSPVHHTFVDFKPCETGYLIFEITNDGVNPADVWKLIHNVIGTNSIPSGNGDPLVNNIETVILFGMWIEGGDVWGPSPTDYHTFDPDDTMLLDEALGLHVDDVAGSYMYLGTLAPGETISIVQTFHMEGDTGNWAQGDQMEFDEEYLAQQTTAPSPAPELPQLAK